MRSVLLVAATLIVAWGCGDSGGLVPEDLPDADAGTPSDSGIDRDGGDVGQVPLESDSDPILARSGTDLASAPGMASCYDADDLACDPEVCADVRSCCIGSGSCCGTGGADPAPSIVVPEGCTDFSEATACIGATVLGFGSPAPYVLGSAIVPNGDGSGDSGLLSAQTVDLTVHRATLSATFLAPTDCGTGCFETVGLGMTTQSDVDGSVRTLASLLFSATRNRMTLVVGESQVEQWPDVTDGSRWTLALEPSGTIRVEADGVEQTTEVVPFQPHAAARVAVYGHSVNPTAGGAPTRIAGVTIDVSLCDVPDAWTGRGSLRVDLPGGGTVSPDRGATAPSLVHAGATSFLAWEEAGTIRLARDHGTGFVADVEPLLVPSAAVWMDDSVGDPELLATADGFVLFFTARGNDLRPSVGRVDLDSALVPADMPAQVVTGALVDGEAASAATVRRSDDGTWVMVVDSSENGIRQFRALRSSDGTNWTRHHSNALETLTRRNPDSAGSAFDAEEIAHPTLTVHNGAWILHYAGRRGTRTSIGLLASDDFVDWRSPTGDAVLSPGSSAIDTVGVDAPAVIVEPEGLTIVYVAQDGYQRRLATASRRATDSGSFF